MQASTRDETRWLARLMAVVPVMLGVRLIVIQVHRFTTDPFTLLMIGISVGISVLLFWLGYRLWTCASIWVLFCRLPGGTPPSLVWLQCRYATINRRLRAGLIGSAAFVIIQWLILLSISLYPDVNFCHRVWQNICWPPRALREFLSCASWPGIALVLFVFVYLCAMGFVIGISISYLRDWLTRLRFGYKPDELEDGSWLNKSVERQ
jgi:hypothetical protein